MATTKTYSWAETREGAAKELGGRYPDAELEQELLEHFRERPAFVVDAIADVVRGYQAGRIRSPWPFLRRRLAEAPADLHVVDEGEKERAIVRAEQWIRTAGLYCDREGELLDELFGDLGKLRAWAGEAALQKRMVALWRQARPQGEALEQAAAERIAEQMAALERAKQNLKTKGVFAGFKEPDQEEWSSA